MFDQGPSRPRLMLITPPDGQRRVFVIACGTEIVTDVDLTFHQLTCLECRFA